MRFVGDHDGLLVDCFRRNQGIAKYLVCVLHRNLFNRYKVPSCQEEIYVIVGF
jgi:hypothetical protein